MTYYWVTRGYSGSAVLFAALLLRHSVSGQWSTCRRRVSAGRLQLGTRFAAWVLTRWGSARAVLPDHAIEDPLKNRYSDLTLCGGVAADERLVALVSPPATICSIIWTITAITPKSATLARNLEFARAPEYTHSKLPGAGCHGLGQVHSAHECPGSTSQDTEPARPAPAAAPASACPPPDVSVSLDAIMLVMATDRCIRSGRAVSTASVAVASFCQGHGAT